MGKRSPILGYNHNVRYRGLVFHVQTEDSGVLSPHLFTHLFHHGVIVSTRKLVYDAGSAEEAIKSLMQAQHKAVLKDLRRGHFDDKIDSYLGGTPGLLPRGAEDTTRMPEVAEAAASESELAPSSTGAVADPAAAAPTEQTPPMFEDLSAPVMIVEKTPPPAPIAPAPVAPPPPAPTVPPSPSQSRPRARPPLPIRSRPALPFARSTPQTLDTTLKTEIPPFDAPTDNDLAPEIEIRFEDSRDAIPVPRPTPREMRGVRELRDTDQQMPAARPRPTIEDVKPHGVVSEEARRASAISDGIPAPIRPSSPTIPPVPTPAADSRRLGDRPSNINAATLPPARPIPRPASRQAMAPPQVVSRPVVSEDRSRRESEAVEVYSPAPPSADLPPGERAPGQYAQHKRSSTRIPIEGLNKERSGGVAVPAGLGPPRRTATAKPNAPLPPTGTSPTAIPRDSRTPSQTEPLRSRAMTPPRVPSPQPSSRSGAHAGSGVVMTRPAVIVGAPAKTTGTIPRIRKAREEEGRGFGQGLISEKSLDEVILAYLSEDADEK